jgi:hypothetical protein
MSPELPDEKPEPSTVHEYIKEALQMDREEQRTWAQFVFGCAHAEMAQRSWCTVTVSAKQPFRHQIQSIHSIWWRWAEHMMLWHDPVRHCQHASGTNRLHRRYALQQLQESTPQSRQRRSLPCKVRQRLHALTACRLMRRKADAVFTVAIAVALVCYGNGEHPTWHLLLKHEGVNREALLASGLLVAVNAAIFVYVQVRVRWLQGVREDPELAPEWALHVAAPCGALAVILFIWACWGLFRWWSIPLAYLYLLAFVMSVQFVPHVGYGQQGQARKRTAAKSR